VKTIEELRLLEPRSWQSQILTGRWQQSADGETAVVEPATGRKSAHHSVDLHMGYHVAGGGKVDFVGWAVRGRLPRRPT
jgi:hypothetical protein